MKRNILTFIFSLALFAPALVFAQPGIPNQFYGTVTLDGVSAPAGLVVEAKVNGTVVGSAKTSLGKYGYDSMFFAINTNGEWNGEKAEFFVGGKKAGIATLSKGASTRLDLVVPWTEPTPVVSSGGGGGGGGGSSPSAGTVVGDTNGDNKVNKYDFALMMSDWGKTGSSVSDLNHDGIVNKYDFSLLMANWSGT